MNSDLPTSIDLRSDTVTKPSAAMRAAMAAAEVGDDVYGEDPTVNRLEQRAAEVFGKEAALFCPTGTMANNIAIKLHTRHGEEVACDAKAHIVDWELSMMAWFSGCIARMIPSETGILRWGDIATALRPKGPNNAPTTLISLENTHNMCGGTVYPPEQVDEICYEAHQRGLKVHMDGARIFNAATASGCPVARITRDCDSVMFCVSKGLGAPAGSLLVSTAENIAQARLYRKRLGGGMRQAGILAAAGLIALEESPKRLQEDHTNARLIARKLAGVPGIRLDVDAIASNIVIFDLAGLGISANDFSRAVKARGVLANGVGSTVVRVVTHCDVTTEECIRAAEICQQVAQELACKNSKDALHTVL